MGDNDPDEGSNDKGSRNEKQNFIGLPVGVKKKKAAENQYQPKSADLSIFFV